MAPETWPAGTRFVLIDGAVGQLDLPASARGRRAALPRSGRPRRAYDHPSYEHRVETFDGVGLRPYRPAHLVAEREADGAVRLAWTRRTRIDGDSWAGTDVPLGEEREAYVVRVIERRRSCSGRRRRMRPPWRYPPEEQAGDGAGRAAALRGGAAVGALRPGTVRKDRDRCLGLPNSRCRWCLPAQAQKHVTVNEALARLDAAAQLRVISFAETTPPASAVDGAGYLVPAGATGAWAGQGRPDRDLVQRRMDLPRAEGGMAGLGRGGGREPDVRRRRMGGERGRGFGGRRRLDLSGARVRSRRSFREAPT